MLREVRALDYFQRSPLAPFIMHPVAAAYSLPVPEGIQPMLDLNKSSYNESQRNAIVACSTAIIHRPKAVKIGLIHGPPGTGKSHTIVGLLEDLQKV